MTAILGNDLKAPLKWTHYWAKPCTWHHTRTALGIITGNASPAAMGRSSVRQLVFNPTCMAKIVRERIWKGLILCWVRGFWNCLLYDWWHTQALLCCLITLKHSGIHWDEYCVIGEPLFLSAYSIILTSPFQRLAWSWLEISNIQPRQLERILVWCLSLLQKIRCLKVHNCCYII